MVPIPIPIGLSMAYKWWWFKLLTSPGMILQVTPENGRKWMGNWGYFTLLIEVKLHLQLDILKLHL